MNLNQAGLISFLWVWNIAKCIQQGSIFDSYEMRNLVWNTEVLYDFTAVSKVTCVMTCSRDSRCLTLTFGQGSNHCKGHSKRMDIYDNPVDTEDTIVFFGEIIVHMKIITHAVRCLVLAI